MATKKTQVPLRTPKAKSKLGLSIPRIGLPHDEFVRGDSVRENEINSVLGLTSQTDMTGMGNPTGLSDRTETTSQTARTTLPSTPSLTSPTIGSSVVSEAEAHSDEPDTDTIDAQTDIIEVDAAAIISDSGPTLSKDAAQFSSKRPTQTSPPSQTALTHGLTTPSYNQPSNLEGRRLPGKSLALYNALHEMTHGAPNPTPSARIRRGELMKRAGIGSRNTFIANLRHLEAAGLVSQNVIVGEPDGNEFHVTPDALLLAKTGPTTPTSQTTRTTRSFEPRAASAGTEADALAETLLGALGQSGHDPETLAAALEKVASRLRGE